MDAYRMNNDKTYVKSPYVEKNVFLTRKAEDPTLPTYDEVAHLLPKPIWDGHDNAISCHDFAWRTAFKNLRPADKNTGYVSNYIDTAFNDCLFMWDSSFIVMFGKYGAKAFDFQKTLDNFYSHQHKDGFICRTIYEDNGGDRFSRFDPSSTGPNIMPWAEWEYYCQTGNTSRLSEIFDPLLAYHLWLKDNHTWRDGTYWSSGWGCGMDNQPRLQPGYNVRFSHGHMVWVDICIQQVLSAKLLIKIAGILGRDDDEGITLLKEEVAHLTEVINHDLWCEDDAFYYDLYKNGKLNYVKSVGAYWALLADIIPAERLERFIAHLDNPAEFKRTFRVPTLSADNPEYVELGDYWRGSIWAPTNYMVLKGLEKNGYEDLAFDIAKNCVENVVSVYDETSTLWENYAPEHIARGGKSRSDFVGWTGLFPISVMFEYVFGIRPFAREKKIVWHVNLTERHGVENYPLGDTTLDLLCEARTSTNDEPIISVKSDKPVTIEVHYGDKIKTILAK